MWHRVPRISPCLGLRPHKLRGDLRGHWSVWVNGSWRITFRFTGGDVQLLDYLDYH
nr:type II toxin-antitoxin system RelE/ParE family toxin [Stenotrophomonas maltophilia]